MPVFPEGILRITLQLLSKKIAFVRPVGDPLRSISKITAIQSPGILELEWIQQKRMQLQQLMVSMLMCKTTDNKYLVLKYILNKAHHTEPVVRSDVS